jgi:hypothetical protein
MFLVVSLAVLSLAGCGGSDGGSDPGGPADPGVPTDPGGPDAIDDPGAPDVPAVDEGPGDPGPGDPGLPDVPEDPGVQELPPTDEGPGDPGPNFDDIVQAYPPRELPFAFTRPPLGEPLTAQEITDFTKDVAAAYKEIGFFRWLLRTSTGVDHTTGTDDYLAWHNDVRAVKSGDTVTFDHRGGEHNMWIPGSIVLSSVMNGYLLTGDWEMARLTEQYCKGLTAVVKGFVWGDDDPAPNLMARAIFPMDHDFAMDADFWKDDGRKKAIKFSSMYHEEDGWNAQTFAWPNNPTWGSIWVTNMRSKDDVRAISRTSTFLPYVVEDAPDAWVRDACLETWQTMQAFHKDIVDHGYFIRTKDRDGVAYSLPCDDNKDLGSYACYIDIDPTNECCARLSADMIAYGERRTNECGTCTGSIYDGFASITHYYNIPIIWDYHMAGVGTSLVSRQYRDAWHALVGLAERMDRYMHPTDDEPGTKDPRWNRDMAMLLVQAASVGLPLTAYEARHVQQYWTNTAAYLRTWDRWDLWAESVPDGEYGVRPPNTNDAVEVEAFAVLFEYCNSPFKNPAGASFVDCAVLADPSSW